MRHLTCKPPQIRSGFLFILNVLLMEMLLQKTLINEARCLVT